MAGDMMAENARSVRRVKKPTLEDVARCADVSYQTVSRVINDQPSVAEATRLRVQRAIEKLDYRPNRTARSLVTRRSNAVGIVSFGAAYYGPTQMLVHIETALKGRGYSLTFTTVDGRSLAAMRHAIGAFTSQNYDGIVMITPVSGFDVASVVALCGDTPFVMIDVDPRERVHSVAIAQAHGATLAAEHLITLGHQTFCEISGPLVWHDARLRHESWLAAVGAAGFTPGPSLESDWTAAGGFAATRQLLDMGVTFTALSVGNDQMALGAIRALRDAGLRVPEDVSVVGFDDVPEAAYFDPPLTTVRQDFVALGEQTVEYLVALIAAPGVAPHQRVLYPQFVVRSSTAPPRAP
jgi:DNA-binding LacI/PurR family transcriptional regulator